MKELIEDQLGSEKTQIAAKIYNIIELMDEDNEYFSVTPHQLEHHHEHRKIELLQKTESALNENEGSIGLTENPTSNYKYPEYLVCICPFCGVEYSEPLEWRQHLNRIHRFGYWTSFNIDMLDTDNARCGQCLAIINNPDIYKAQIHIITHLPYPQYVKCKLCFKSWSALPDAMVHFKKQHSVSIEWDECFIPRTKRKYMDQAPRHTKGADENESAWDESVSPMKKCEYEEYLVRLCPFCSVEFSNRYNWRRHLNTVHQFGDMNSLNIDIIDRHTAKCRECDLPIKNLDIYRAQVHRITHLPYPRYVKCKLCVKFWCAYQSAAKHCKKLHKAKNLEKKEYHAFKNRNNFSGTGTHLTLALETVTQQPETTETENVDDPSLANVINQAWRQCQFSPHIDRLCPYCGEEFSSRLQWRQHLNSVHKFGDLNSLNVDIIDKSKAWCRECCKPFYFKYIYNAQLHRITHLPHRKYFKCNLCLTLYSTFEKARLHLSEDHALINGVQCSSFNETTPKRTIYERNIIRLCPVCGIELSNRVNWCQHLNLEHKFSDFEFLSIEILDDTLAKCQICSLIFKLRHIGTAETHGITHLPYPRYLKCKLCDKDFTFNIDILKHLSTEHRSVNEELALINSPDIQLNDDDRLECSYCRKLSEHNIVYSCPDCFKELDSEPLWRWHISTHNYNSLSKLGFAEVLAADMTPKEYQCLECDTKFREPSWEYMREHSLQHFSTRSLKCRYCKRSFDTKNSALEHVCPWHATEETEYSIMAVTDCICPCEYLE